VEDVQVEIYNGNLVIKGESKTATERSREEAYYRTERTFGSFYRSLPLPWEVTPEQIKATLTDGVFVCLIGRWPRRWRRRPHYGIRQLAQPGRSRADRRVRSLPARHALRAGPGGFRGLPAASQPPGRSAPGLSAWDVVL
jgi:Hsp20/alpha crystallin family